MSDVRKTCLYIELIHDGVEAMCVIQQKKQILHDNDGINWSSEDLPGRSDRTSRYRRLGAKGSYLTLVRVADRIL